jgi:hypothetical protein
MAFRNPGKIGRVSGISGRKRSRTVRKCIQKFAIKERRKANSLQRHRGYGGKKAKDDPNFLMI